MMMLKSQSSGGGRIRAARASQDDQQLKTFTRWWDSHLAPRGHGPVVDLLVQIRTGVLPMRLLEALDHLEDGALLSLRAKTNMQVQRIENLNFFFQALKERKIKTENIGSEDLERGDKTPVLGLTWTLILRYEMSLHISVGTSGGNGGISSP